VQRTDEGRATLCRDLNKMIRRLTMADQLKAMSPRLSGGMPLSLALAQRAVLGAVRAGSMLHGMLSGNRRSKNPQGDNQYPRESKHPGQEIAREKPLYPFGSRADRRRDVNTFSEPLLVVSGHS
jgi:hypothetical protein